MDEAQLKSELQKYFGYPAFKEGQLDPILSVLAAIVVLDGRPGRPAEIHG